MLLLLFLVVGVGAIPADPFNFTQKLDHFGAGDVATFQQRYYKNESWFRGPGSPILCIMGGEEAVPPSTGIFYPFVTDILAKRYGAAVVELEHRYYGTSLPFFEDESFTNENLQFATPQQALADAASFIQAMREGYGCDPTPDTENYCPVITIGGSYPGWLSAMMRLRYPAIVDGAYAASAPMKFYSQEVSQFDYYKVVTASAERAVEGCADAVRGATTALLGLTKAEAVEALNLCESLPNYLVEGDDALFMHELLMVFMYTFAGLNMANYPPNFAAPAGSMPTDLENACNALVATATEDPFGALSRLLSGYASVAQSSSSSASRLGKRLGMMTHKKKDENKDPGHLGGACFNMTTQLPGGDNGSISGGDWSGCGTGRDGELWDYETCGYLVEQIGVNNETDMFPPREWTMDWLNDHCASRFGPGAIPQPTALADAWGFSTASLATSGASKIVFTNGLNDGWSAGGITEDVGSKDLQLLAVNMESGAHHSDLSHFEPDPATDTADVVLAREQVGDILAGWLGLE